MLKGIAASSGIAIGKVYKLVEPKIEIVERACEASMVREADIPIFFAYLRKSLSLDMRATDSGWSIEE